jgi:hypothetical protein
LPTIKTNAGYVAIGSSSGRRRGSIYVPRLAKPVPAVDDARDQLVRKSDHARAQHVTDQPEQQRASRHQEELLAYLSPTRDLKTAAVQNALDRCSPTLTGAET